jgi:predicted nucleic acid-binding protein
MTLAWLFADETAVAAREAFEIVNESGAWVPSIWRLEVANSLQTGLRRGRIDAAFRDAALADLSLMDISIDPETDDHAWTTSLRVAERHRLTLYDAAYLELAQRRNLPLASLDRELLAAATAVGVETLGS